MKKPNRFNKEDIKKTDTETEPIKSGLLEAENGSESGNPKKKMGKIKKTILIVILSLVGIVLTVGLVFGIIYLKGKSSIKQTTPPAVIEVDEDIADKVEQTGNTVYYNGEKYVYNDNTIPILFMGVNKKSLDDNKGVGLNGESDANFLCVLNTVDSSVSVLPINRDTLVEVDKYAVDGTYIDSEKMQLCLAYAYGDGKEKSCENVIKSVSRLLCNIPISFYMVVDTEAIPMLNSKVGGVTVPEYTKDGSKQTGRMITLNSKNVLNYIQSRNIAELDSNLNREERQKIYIKAFLQKAVERTKSDFTFPITLFNSLNNYMITNLDSFQITYLAANYLTGAENMQMYSIDGEVTKIEEYAAFIPDSTSIFETVLNLFYIKQE